MPKLVLRGFYDFLNPIKYIHIVQNIWFKIFDSKYLIQNIQNIWYK